MQDLRYALRQLLKSPSFTLVAVLSLAIGIGACTLTFSWILRVLVDAIPGAQQPDRLVVLASRHTNGRIGDTLSLPDVTDLAAHSNVFRGILCSQMEAVSARIGPDPEWLWAQPVTANFFEVLGVRPILGRGFQPDEDDHPGGDNVVVLSHGLWSRRFGGDPGVLGRSVEIGRRVFTVIGVAPADFRGTMGGLGFDLWYPVTMSNEHHDPARILSSRGIRWLHTIARLNDDVRLDQAQAATDIVTRQLEAAHPNSNRNFGVAVLPVWRSPWGAQGALLPLLAALATMAALLLALVIANVANLLLARATARECEMSVRLALGASSRRLIRQVLVESIVLATAGGLAGCALAALLRKSLLSFLPASYLPIQLDFRIDTRVIVFTALTTLATGILFGLAPAWRAARANISDSLKAGGRTGTGSRHGLRLRQSLVVAEVAAAAILLVGMTLCARSFDRARRLYVGFEPAQVWVAGFRLPHAHYSEPQAAEFYDRLRQRLEEIPAVRSVAFSDWLPLGFEGGSSTSFSVPGYTPAPGENVDAGISQVSHRYFETLQLPIVSGRPFDARDQPDAPPVVVINQEFARRYFHGRDPLGLPIDLWGRSRTVVGVARTGKYRSLNEPPRSYVYIPVEQTGDHTLAAVIRTEGNPAPIAASIERVAATLDPHARPMASMPMTHYMAAAYMIPRTAASLIAILGAAALFLSALGIYGVIATSVGRRTREVGIRMALGANRASVLRLFLLQGLRLVATGAAVGVAASLAGGRLLAQLLVDVSAFDPWSYAAALPVLAAIAVLACWIPARNAAAVDPIQALRNE